MPSSLRFVMVVGVDFSDQSDLALRRAFELGLDQGVAEIHAVHVVRSFESGVQLEAPTNLGLTTVSLAEAGEHLKEHLEQRMAEFAQTVDRPERTRAIDRAWIFGSRTPSPSPARPGTRQCRQASRGATQRDRGPPGASDNLARPLSRPAIEGFSTSNHSA